MPIDQWGRRAHLVFCGDSVTKRMNPGIIYEHYVNATSWWVRQNLIKFMDRGRVDDAWRYLMAYYSVASPLQYEEYLSFKLSPAEKLKELNEQIHQHRHPEFAVSQPVVRLLLPPHSPNIGAPQIQQLRESFPIPIGPVTYKDYAGKEYTTKDPVLIGSMYVMLLEKIGDDAAAGSSFKRQHYGILAKLTQNDRNSKPWRENPTRILGEAEIRLLVAKIGPQATADFLEMQNSPAAQKAIAYKLLTADNPMDIQAVWDKHVVKRGNGRSYLFVNHVMECSGRRFTTRKRQEARKQKC